MSLPPPPKELARFVETSALHCALNDMVQAYGQQCREAALEEAAQVCDERANGENDAQYCADRIRSLK